MASVARRYSRALVGLCEKDKSHEAVAKDLQGFLDALSQNPDIQAALTSPTFAWRTKQQVLEAIIRDLGVARTAANFLLYVNRKNRLPELGQILEDFREKLDELAGRVRAGVVTATPLNALDQSRIQRALERTTGKKVILETGVDAALVGGAVTTVGNIVLDGSIRTGLERMKEQLTLAVQ